MLYRQGTGEAVMIANRPLEAAKRACQVVRHRWSEEERLRRRCRAEAMQAHLAASLGLARGPALAPVRAPR
ncbi:MAG: hypothetical protein AAFV43_06710 [Planctomycetota bacterium]